MSKSASTLALLRARIATLEGLAEGPKTRGVSVGAVPVGAMAIDAALPWGGLPVGCLHEIAPVRHPDGIEDCAASGFAALLLGRLARATGRPALWISAGDPPYAPALAALGLAPGRLILVRPRKPAEVLWAAEEGLRCPALGGVLAEMWELDPTAARRLHLAARESGVPMLVLNRGRAAGVAVTRWRVETARGTGAGVELGRWRVELARCRGLAEPRVWEVEWNDEAGGLGLAAAAGDREAAPQRMRAAR